MNREIKFRAWNGNNMVDLYSTTKFAIKDGFEMDGLFIPFYKDYTLMQYTGLKDKNGKEIYEGDVIDCNMIYNYGSLPHRGVIEYNSNYGSFATRNDAGQTMLHNHFLNSIEVIGNIYENPDLIK